MADADADNHQNPVATPQSGEEDEKGSKPDDRAWWRRPRTVAACSAERRGPARVALVQVQIAGIELRALLDSGATCSFVSSNAVQKCGLRVSPTAGVIFCIADSGDLVVNRIARNVTFFCDGAQFSYNFYVGPIPYDVILGYDWLYAVDAVWGFRRNSVLARTGSTYHVFRVTADLAENPGEKTTQQPREPKPLSETERACETLRAQLADLEPETVKQLIKAQRKKYRKYVGKRKEPKVSELVEAAHCIGGQQSVAAHLLHCAYPKVNETNCNEATQGVLALAVQQRLSKGDPEPNSGRPQAEEPGPEEPSTWHIRPRKCSAFTTWLTKGDGAQLNESVRELLWNHAELFPDALPPGVPPHRPQDHHIVLANNKVPPKGGPIRLQAEQFKAQQDEINRLLDNGWIVTSPSPIYASSFMVDKKPGPNGEKQYRMVVNYQGLNSVTVVPEFPLPNIQTILELLGGARVFTILDLDSGFHQIRLAAKDRWKTAFRSPLGLFEFKVMPFGLKGAPATFQANVNFYLRKLLGKGVMVYLDDILIYSKTLKEHVVLLGQVLHILEIHCFFPKLSKCHFAVLELDYLGYHISARGLSPQSQRVAVIVAWPEILSDVHEVRRFLGVVNYCRIFMGPAFVVFAKPLVDLTRKNRPFRWTEAHIRAVRALKNELVYFTELQIPDTSQPFQLFTDASGFAIGAVLEQQGKPVGFLSLKLSPAEQRYCVYDQELLALIAALAKWRYLLLTASVTAYTDHQALTHLQRLKGDKPLKGRTARWLDFLAELQDLKIVYKEGRSNVVADALSRQAGLDAGHAQPTPARGETLLVVAPKQSFGREDLLSIVMQQKRYDTRGILRNYRGEEVCDAGNKRTRRKRRVLPVHQPQTPTNAATTEETAAAPLQQPQPELPAVDFTTHPSAPEAWRKAYAKCPVFSEAYTEAVQAGDAGVKREVAGKLLHFRIRGHQLLAMLNGLWRVCVSDDAAIRVNILYQNHDHPTAGHLGQKKTFNSISKYYYWPGMKQYSDTYVETCVRCRTSKTVSQKPAGLLQPLVIPTRRWEEISLDFITCLPPSKKGNDAILVVVDSLSKMAHFIALRISSSATEVLDLLANFVVRYHGIPRRIVSDRDPRFQSEVWRALCQRFAITQAMSTANHPQTDGQTERLTRTLEQMIRTYIQADDSEWEDLLPALELAYNSTPHSSTQLSPFEVMIGENPIRAQDLDVIADLEPLATPAMTRAFRVMVDRARANLLKAKRLQKHYADGKRREVEFAMGEKVFVAAKFLLGGDESTKLVPRYRGPFEVVERIGKVAYRLDLPPTYLCHNVFHVSTLLKFAERPSEMQTARDVEGWRPTAASHQW